MMPSHATIGVMSIMPSDGITRRNGTIIQSVSTYDQRIHFEYGEIGSHVENTRTNRASFKIENAHDNKIIGASRGC